MGVTVAATGQSNVPGSVFVPKTAEVFTHDDDGNLTGDGRWTYEWDAENRLKVMRSLAGSPAPERRIEFVYDSKGRRIRQTVWNDRTSGGTTLSDTCYLYDGWNLVAELSSGSLVRSYVWGTDLSGSQQGAGGVGGLLQVNFHGIWTTNCFVVYDGNGNVMALVNAGNGETVGQYEYGPFGEPLRVTGDLAKANPIRFSTKYQDSETDLLYYGHRYYNANTGRWLSRDPIEEYGGVDLYGFVANRPIGRYDVLGLAGPLATFALDCIKKIAANAALGWLKDASDKNLACHAVREAIQADMMNVHIGCNGEKVFDGSPFMHNDDRGIGRQLAGCLWDKIKSKGISKILKDLPEGAEKELLEEALGEQAGNFEDQASITDAKSQIHAKCTDKGINVSVSTKVTVAFGGKTFDLSNDSKELGSCGKGFIWDAACTCCAKSPHN